eukprot:TRINITY_DN30273_c0_g1_i1.p1 TRINITY_DN30273_c0_g1~~TRINITY_DN30273_c0_g1_i1.p1  ORF type:complete len:197 (+),score=60.16 TRINITY_DN30273_c0_g1_i1:63-653(+)
MSRTALRERAVNTLREGGITWEVKGNANLSDITAKLASLSLEKEQGVTGAAVAARKVLESDKVLLRDADGKVVQLKKVKEVREYQEEEVFDDSDDGHEFADAMQMAKVGRKRNTTETPNPILEQPLEAYIDDEVKASDAWKSLTLSTRQKFVNLLLDAIESPTRSEALKLVNKAFSASGKNETRLRNAMPWLVEEF